MFWCKPLYYYLCGVSGPIALDLNAVTTAMNMVIAIYPH